MDQERYKECLVDFVRTALDRSDGTPTGAANYLGSRKKPGFLASEEKKMAFERVKKVFTEMRDRPLWMVLKGLGLEVEDVE